LLHSEHDTPHRKTPISGSRTSDVCTPAQHSHMQSWLMTTENTMRSSQRRRAGRRAHGEAAPQGVKRVTQTASTAARGQPQETPRHHAANARA
jgi:hypothetical protein